MTIEFINLLWWVVPVSCWSGTQGHEGAEANMDPHTAVLLAFIGATWGYHSLEGYHFQEAYIDEFLWPEVEEEHMLEQKNRFTRAVDEETAIRDCCIQQKAMEFACCGAVGVFKTTSQLRALTKECIAEVKTNELKSACQSELEMYKFSMNEKSRKSEQNICIRECLGMKMKVLDGEGNILEAAMKESNQLEDVKLWDDDVPDKMIDHCLEMVKARSAENPYVVDGKKVKCNPAAFDFHRCLWRNLEINCLKENQKNTTQCVKRQKVFVREEAKWQKCSNKTYQANKAN